jgi:hypothetical protein
MKKIIITAAVLLLVSSIGFSADTDMKNTSATTGRYLDLYAGAAGSAMGGAYIGSCDDASSVFWNPAGLASMKNTEKKWSMFFSHNVWLMDMMMDHLSAAGNFGKFGAAAFGIGYFNAGEMRKYEIDAENNYIEAGSFSPYAITASLSYSNTLEKNIDFGVTLKYILDTIDGSTISTGAFDLGLRYKSPLEGLFFNLLAKNFAGTLGGNILPKGITFGAFYTIDIYDYNLSAEYNLVGKVNNNAVHRAGISLKTPFLFTARAGYQTDNTGVTAGLKGLTCGVGLNIEEKFVDFSYEPYGELGNSFKVSLGGAF